MDLEVSPGEVVLLAGPNGSGKTTLLRLMAGLYRPSRGTVRIFGADPEAQRLECRGRLTLVSHQSYLYERLTAAETLQVWARLAGKELEEGDAGQLLELVGLHGRRRLTVSGFSAGMRKRLTLLRTRLEEPALVLLDEPLSALDAAGRTMVEGWIRDFSRRGVAVVMASHALERMAPLCDRALLLESGQVAWEGPGARLLVRMGESG